MASFLNVFVLNLAVLGGGGEGRASFNDTRISFNSLTIGTMVYMSYKSRMNHETSHMDLYDPPCLIAKVYLDLHR